MPICRPAYKYVYTDAIFSLSWTLYRLFHSKRLVMSVSNTTALLLGLADVITCEWKGDALITLNIIAAVVMSTQVSCIHCQCQTSLKLI